MDRKEIEIKKHSAVVQMSNKITAQQRKAFNALIYIAWSILKEQPQTYKFTIDLANLKKLVGIESTTNNIQLKQSLEGLVHTVVKFNILGKDKKEIWGTFALLAGATIKNGNVEFSFAHQIYETLLNPRIYAAIDLNVIKGLDSKYSIALYELAQDYINVEIPKMSIETFRELRVSRRFVRKCTLRNWKELGHPEIGLINSSFHWVIEILIFEMRK